MNTPTETVNHFSSHVDGDGSADELSLLNSYDDLTEEKRNYIGKLKEFLDRVRDEDAKRMWMIIDLVISAFHSMLNETQDDINAVCDYVIDTVEGYFLWTAVNALERALLYRIKADFYRY